ncbi:prephenate dehydratase [Pseudobacteroides cellulosolvens]|uniref:Prephenate dehydratase n=1 Tax=Pseudobacteroides cellulosolvens ATCC 35603 = DSM 2933 TaxID=398512 RepID=A0A0L6JS63_9FIRM|nr:prephenate dehydratase [Pseudobacteroides cellulosolvens]KNY28643.1 Prephenate dehydratase [Pseudobacteroides cellulosolvens ATCC 35603 = DSM 2933]
MIKIGYLGPKGTFSQEATLRYIEERKIEDYEIYEYNGISDLIFAVDNKEIDEGVAPIENSLEGAVNVTLDILAADVNLMIKDEIVISIVQNLLIKKGTDPDKIQCIISHPQPIGQCRKFINSKYPNAHIKYVYSTAGAAEEVAQGDGSKAAIGSAIAANVYGLEMLEKGIQDSEINATRFAVIARNDSVRTGNDKTSIVFSTEDKPGSLYRILDIFNLWDINMTRIESRPAKNELGKYIFFIDLLGHKDDEDLKDALTMVKRKSSFYKFLGSYPIFA